MNANKPPKHDEGWAHRHAAVVRVPKVLVLVRVCRSSHANDPEQMQILEKNDIKINVE